MSSSSDLQRQDLGIYEGTAALTTKAPGHLNLILYRRETKPTWLNVGLVESCVGRSPFFNTSKSAGTPKVGNGDGDGEGNVCFFSFTNDSSLYEKQRFARLTGVKFVFLGGDSDRNYWDRISKEAGSAANVFIEDPQFALFLGDGNADTVIKKLNQLNQKCNLYLVMPIDEELLDYTELADDLSTSYSTLLMKLLHRAHLLLTLRPLRTGRADDITGELVLNKGTVDLAPAVKERDYLYLVSKDTVKLFYR